MKNKSEKTHWTGQSTKDYLFRIVADFISQLESKMEAMPISQAEYAKKLRVSKGRVSQFLNHPGNFKLENIIKYAKALGIKVSIVAYDDNDPKNIKGPINSEIFRMSWEQLGKPRDFWAMQNNTANNRYRRADDVKKMFSDFKMFEEKKGTTSDLSDFTSCPALIPTGRSAWNKTIENIKPS